MFLSCLAISIILEPLEQYQNTYWLQIWSLCIIIGATIVSGLFQNIFLKTALIGLSLLIFFIGNEKIVFGEYQIETASISFIGHVYLGFLFPNVAYLKSYFFKKWWKIDAHESLFILWPYILGLSLFAGFFHFSFAGLLAVIIGLFAFVLSDMNRSNIILTSLLFLSASIGFYGLSYIDTTSIISPNVMLSVGLAIGAYRLLQLAVNIHTRKLLNVLIFAFISSCSILLPLFLGGKNISFGGQGAFVISLFLISFISKKEPTIFSANINRIFFSLTAGLALLIFSFQNKNYQAQGKSANFNTLNQTDLQDKNFNDVKSSPFSLIIGDYTLASKGNKFNFELGPKDSRTKGEFKNITGKIHVDKDLTKSSFEIELPINSLTTFESSRDEALMSDFFYPTKFPNVSFKSTKIELDKDNLIVIGDFNMLGVTKQLHVKIKYSGNNSIDGVEMPVFEGIGSLDRTSFGMESDPSIGNLVEYNFKIFLKK